MGYLLHIDSSSTPETSISRSVAGTFRSNWRGTVVHRDLSTTPPPHLTAAGVRARLVQPSRHTPEEAAAAAIQDELIDEFLGASTYLLTVPMYNFAMPSVFKAWIDQLVVIGRTVSIDGDPPAANRPAVVISARGGSYSEGAPNQGMDFAVPAVAAILGSSKCLGLQLHIIIPEMTLAPVDPTLAHFRDCYEASLATAHRQARQHAVDIAATLTVHRTNGDTAASTA